MLFEIMTHVRNFFPAGKYKEGNFLIENGTISLPFVKDGEYIKIEGSSLNNGVYEYPVSGLRDEEFTGAIVALAPPADFLKLVEEIEEYTKKYNATPYQSESFGGYSYTKSEKDGWESAFKTRLNAWRKI